MSLPRPSERIQLAQFFFQIQPTSIRTRLLADEPFIERLQLQSDGVLSLGGFISVARRQLFASARQVLADRQPKELIDLKGRRFVLETRDDAVMLRSPVGEEQAWAESFPHLVILSPYREERITAVDGLLRALGPAVPTFSVGRDIAAERELTDEEASELIAEAFSGVAALQRKAEQAIEAGATRVVDLVPEDVRYYEHLCGPDPGVLGPEAYLREVLPRYRGELLRRDLFQGLRICLLGALRDDVSPGGWMTDVGDDELWAALEEWLPERSPFAVLGGIDVALRRQHDERFRGFAETAIDKLLSDLLPQCTGVDAYEMFLLFAQLTLNRLNTIEGGASRAPFWKRMSAWMHAGFLAQITGDCGLEGPAFRDWLSTQLSITGLYAQILDLRREPMFLAAEISRIALRGEVLGRLQMLRARVESQGLLMPSAARIQVALVESENDPSQLGWVFPGPLEGHCRPALLADRVVREEDAEMLAGKVGTDPGGPFLRVLANLSQRFDLGEMLLSRAREAARSVSFSGSTEKQQAVLQSLAWGGLVAAAQRDTELARAIGTAIVLSARMATTGEVVGELFRGLLLAGAAFEDEQEWSRWIDEHLSQVASVLSRGEPMRAFLAQLAVLKTVVDLTLAIHVRAEALAFTAT